MARARGLLRAYIERMTGLSGAQTTRSIGRHLKTGRLRPGSPRRHRFSRRLHGGRYRTAGRGHKPHGDRASASGRNPQRDPRPTSTGTLYGSRGRRHVTKNTCETGCGKDAPWEVENRTFPPRLDIPQTTRDSHLATATTAAGSTQNRTFYVLRNGHLHLLPTRG